jgi:glutamyl-tRNA synthetase
VKVRTRVAPSPTGDPHVGTAYIALFNYAFAKKHNGSFLLRIDDTDRVRSYTTHEEAIISSLKWLGLQWDEGPDVGGWCGPYRQSERLDIYNKHVRLLLDMGKAYYCFCSTERLATLREAQRQAKLPPGYDKHCRHLFGGEIQAKLKSGAKYVIRMAVPTTGSTTFKDELRGDITIAHDVIDDQILMKADGFPTYHLASVVDDHLMDITHIIRAEEWLSSTAKHVLLFKAFDWSIPKFVHMPLLRNLDKSKISKRENATSLKYYRDTGYLPEALRNFLSNMGFSFGGDREKYTLDEFINVFSLTSPTFDVVKLDKLNGSYIRELSDEQLFDKFTQWKLNKEYFLPIFHLVKTRINKLDQIMHHTSIFFDTKIEYKDMVLPKSKDQCLACLKEIVEALDLIKEWKTGNLHEAIVGRINAQWQAHSLFALIRLAITGRTYSLPLQDIMEKLGRDVCRFRIIDFMHHIETIRDQ